MSSVLPPPKKNLKTRRKAIIALDVKSTIKREGMGLIQLFDYLFIPKNENKLKTFQEKKKSESVFLLGELKKCDLLRPLTDDQFNEMVAVAKRREIKKTEFIIKEDEDGKEIFVLEQGRIEVSYYDEDGTRKKLKEIDAPGADEFQFAFTR